MDGEKKSKTPISAHDTVKESLLTQTKPVEKRRRFRTTSRGKKMIEESSILKTGIERGESSE